MFCGIPRASLTLSTSNSHTFALQYFNSPAAICTSTTGTTTEYWRGCDATYGAFFSCISATTYVLEFGTIDFHGCTGGTTFAFSGACCSPSGGTGLGTFNFISGASTCSPFHLKFSTLSDCFLNPFDVYIDYP